jgi:hypothetical protein
MDDEMMPPRKANSPRMKDWPMNFSQAAKLVNLFSQFTKVD